MPGAEFKRIAEKYRETNDAQLLRPYEFVLREIVRYHQKPQSCILTLHL